MPAGTLPATHSAEAATLKPTIGELLGVPIHYFAAVDMAGFQQVIDAIGGVK